ncbi:hypothetical protein AB0O00_33760, partial [Kitasatospora sp. NPDC093558]
MATLPLPTATPHLRAVRSVQPVPSVPSVPPVPSGAINSQSRVPRSVPSHVLPPRSAPVGAPVTPVTPTA